MKLPRWLVITLLASSLLTIFATSGWWWVTWPERTIRQFRLLINEGRVDQANLMIQNPSGSISDEVAISSRFWRRHPDEELLFPESPSLVHLMTARRICTLPASRVVVIVERSTINAWTENGGVCNLRVLAD